MAFLDEIGLQYYDQKVKEYINKQLQGLDIPSSSLRLEIVENLPDSGDTGVIYLVPLASGGENNTHEEFFWTGDSFEFIGTNSFNIDGTEQVTGIIYNEEKDSIAEGIKESLGALNSALGDRSHAEGGPYQAGAVGSIAQGRASHAEGATTKAVADATHTEGILTVAGREVAALQQAATDLGISGTIEEIAAKLLGYGAHAEGSQSQALGSSSHAEGDKTQALANATHSEGSETVAFGEASHAEGFKTRAEGNQSHAEGRMTLATGNSSHAEGNETEASGAYSHAEGSNTTAEKRDSHAEGAYTKAAGIASHAEGEHTSTSNTAEHAEGAYNYTNTGDTDSECTISSIGIGNNTSSKNAFEVMKDGAVYVYGVGGYDGTNVVSPNTSGIIGQSLQKYLSSQQPPQVETPSTQNTLPEITTSLYIEVEGGEPTVEINPETLDTFTSIVQDYQDQPPKLVTIDIKKVIWDTTPSTVLSYTTLGTLKVTTGPGEVSGGEGIHWNVVICIGDLIFIQKGESQDQDGEIFWAQGMESDTLLPTKTSSLS